jgi:exopolysaccharide production protein ExoZ
VHAKIGSIELLRGLAAIAVMGYHYSSGQQIPLLSPLFATGYIGVDLFFMVSGFVMYVSTERDRDAGPFLVRRMARIVPLAWTATILLLATPDPYGSGLWRDLLFIPGPMHSNPPQWTLFFELVFDGAFALMLAVPIARDYRGIATTALLVAMMVSAQGGHLNLDHAQDHAIVGQELGDALFFYFPIGMAAAWLYLRFEPGPATRIAFAVVCAGAAVWLLGTKATGHGLIRIGVAAIPIFGAFIVLRELPRPLGRFATAAGALSYGIYLMQFVIFFLPIPGSIYAHSPTILFLERAVLTVALATVTYFLIERPFQRAARRAAAWLSNGQSRLVPAVTASH